MRCAVIPGQIAVAATLSALMQGSEIRESHRHDDTRVQDPYCLRCQPQVMGACMDLVQTAGDTLEREANAVTDNPLVFSDHSIVSGGNFHAEPVAFAADQLALAIAETGAIAQRRIAVLVEPALNFGCRPSLRPNPGLNSGFMIAEVTSAALMAENKQMAAPCSVDSTPTSANQEDHVSMATHAAARLPAHERESRPHRGDRMLAAAQGIELRGPLKTSKPLSKAVEALRGHVTVWTVTGILPATSRSRRRLPRRERWNNPPANTGSTGDRDDHRRHHGRFRARPVGDAAHGTFIPDEIADRLNETGAERADTDWHIDQLYDGLLDGATIVRALFHRYVIDPNRDPSGVSLYPGQNTTSLCPLTDFEGVHIWRPGQEPTSEEISEPAEHFHAVYHRALADQIERVPPGTVWRSFMTAIQSAPGSPSSLREPCRT